jgi:hypothetical protein
VRYLLPSIVAWLVLLLGAVLATLGAVELQREIQLSAKGVHAHGTVVAFELPRWRYPGAVADLDLEVVRDTPIRVHVKTASLARDWRKGEALALICESLSARAPACRPDVFADRWLAPALLLLVGVPAVAVGGRMLLRA